MTCILAWVSLRGHLAIATVLLFVIDSIVVDVFLSIVLGSCERTVRGVILSAQIALVAVFHNGVFLCAAR